MKYSVIVLKTEYPVKDFAAERNKLLKRSQTEWVLFIDSDEEISKELREEIEKLDSAKEDGYLIRRKDFFWGKWLRYGEAGNTWLLRLGKKTAGKWKRKVHEVWDIDNPGRLNGVILHYPHKTIRNFISKINLYTEIDAEELGRLKIFDWLKPLGKFLINYFLRLGFLDGTAGFVHAYMMSFQSLVVRVKQYELLKTLKKS